LTTLTTGVVASSAKDQLAIKRLKNNNNDERNFIKDSLTTSYVF